MAGLKRPYSGNRPITSEYGNRSFYFNGKLVTDFHGGIDIGGGNWDVEAAGDGVVIAAFTGGRVDSNPNINTPANYVKIDHGGGVITGYWHLSQVSVKVGQRVSKGQKIGITGRTGYATGVHLHFIVWINGVSKNPRDYVNFNSDTSLPVNSNNMGENFITVQSGWGLSHVAQAAGLSNPGSPDTWAYIYSLNQGFRGSWDWQSLNARMGSGDTLRVRPDSKPTPTPITNNEELKQKEQEIAKLKEDKAKAEAEAKKKYEELVLAEAEKDRVQLAEVEKLKEEKRIELERLSNQLQKVTNEYQELEQSSIKIDNSEFSAQATELAVYAVSEELKAQGIKEKWHAWVDRNFKSNFVRQFLKYTWPAWLFFLLSISILWAQNYKGDNQIIAAIGPMFITIGTAIVQFLLTNFDKNKDSKVDFRDFEDQLK